jgi:hypothetical protein
VFFFKLHYGHLRKQEVKGLEKDMNEVWKRKKGVMDYGK